MILRFYPSHFLSFQENLTESAVYAKIQEQIQQRLRVHVELKTSELTRLVANCFDFDNFRSEVENWKLDFFWRRMNPEASLVVGIRGIQRHQEDRLREASRRGNQDGPTKRSGLLRPVQGVEVQCCLRTTSVRIIFLSLKHPGILFSPLFQEPAITKVSEILS